MKIVLLAVGLSALSAGTYLQNTGSSSGAGGNLPPVCMAGGDITVPAQGPQTTVMLDGSGSFDPDGDPIFFFWQTGCPNGVFGDPNSPITTLTFDTPAGQDVNCSVRLFVTDNKATVVCRLFIRVFAPSMPDLDIKPGSCPNPIQVGSNGVVPVSLIGTSGFDVSQVDVSTLMLMRSDGVGGAVSPIQATIGDTSTPLEEVAPCDCHTLTGDGIEDLDLKFDKGALTTAFQLPAQPNFSFLSLTLTGMLDDGTPFSVTDCIRVQGN